MNLKNIKKRKYISRAWKAIIAFEAGIGRGLEEDVALACDTDPKWDEVVAVACDTDPKWDEGAAVACDTDSKWDEAAAVACDTDPKWDEGVAVAWDTASCSIEIRFNKTQTGLVMVVLRELCGTIGKIAFSINKSDIWDPPLSSEKQKNMKKYYKKPKKMKIKKYRK